MILAYFICLACSLLSVFAKIENYVIPEHLIEIDNSDTIPDPEILYNKYMTYDDAKEALQSILGSINNLNNLSFDAKVRPVKTQTNTRQNHIMIDNFGYVIRYKTDRNLEEDNGRFDREKRDIPALNTSSLGVIRVTIIPPEGKTLDTSKLGTLHLKYVPRSYSNVTRSSGRQQKVPTSAGYTHDPDTCKMYNNNLQELWTTLRKYIESDDVMPHKLHLHNIALIIKAYFEHHTTTNSEPNKKPEKEKPVITHGKIEDDKIVNEVIEDIKNNIASYRDGDTVSEIVDIVLTKLKPANNDFYCNITGEESLHDVVDLAYQKYLEDVDCREGKDDMVDLTRIARHQDIRKMFLPYNKHTNGNHRKLRKPKKATWTNYDDYIDKPLLRSDNPNKFYNEMLKLYEEENQISNGIRACESNALKTFVNSIKFIVQRFIKKSECGRKNSTKPNIIDKNETGQHVPISNIHQNLNNKLINNDFRIPVSPDFFKTDYSMPVLKTSMKSHHFINRDLEKNDYSNAKDNSIIQKNKLNKPVNPYGILLNPDSHEITHIKEMNVADDKFTEKQYNNNNDAQNSLDTHGTHKEKSNAISFQSLLDSINENPEIAELTYIISEPQVIMYQPQYLVKHRLPYETYLKNYKNKQISQIELLNAVKLFPSGSKLLYKSNKNEEPLRYREKKFRKVLDIAKAADVSNSINIIHVIPKNTQSTLSEEKLKRNKNNESHTFYGNFDETHNIGNFKTTDQVETFDEFFIDNEDEAMKNKSNLQLTGSDLAGKEIHTNGNGKILWNSYPIKRPKYTYNRGVSLENKQQIKT